MMKRFCFLALSALISVNGYSQTILENFFTAEGGSTPITLNGGQKCGQRFTATLPFEGIEVNGPTWSVNGEKGMTIRLYEWAGSYAATVAQEPIVTRVLENLDDNGWFPCYAPRELPPGEYFWEASEPNNSNPDAIDPHQIGCWLWEESKYAGGEAYFNGVPYGEVSVTWYRIYGEGQGGAWTPTPFPDSDNPTLAQSFYSFAPFQGVSIASPTWNGTGAGYRISLYRWNTDYNTTVSGTPIAQRTIENHSDNARGELLLDTVQPAGQYLLLTDEPVRGTGNVGHWGWMDSDWWDDENIAWADGEEIVGFLSFDVFLGEPAEEVSGKDFASRSLEGVMTKVKDWSVF